MCYHCQLNNSQQKTITQNLKALVLFNILQKKPASDDYMLEQTMK